MQRKSAKKKKVLDSPAEIKKPLRVVRVKDGIRFDEKKPFGVGVDERMGRHIVQNGNFFHYKTKEQINMIDDELVAVEKKPDTFGYSLPE